MLMRLLAVLFVIPFFSSLAASPQSLLQLPSRVETLPNGLRVFLVKYPSPNVIAFQLAVRAGSRNEVEKGKTGFAHFFEHLMFRGTKSMTGKQFGDLYAKLGVEHNAWTWFDMTNYHGVVAKAYLPQILHAEADRFMNLSFDEKQLRDEAGAVLGEYNKSVAQPEFLLEEKLHATAFTKHPYGHTTMGYKEDVEQFPERYADVWPFFKRYYRPGNVAVILVGDVDFDRDLKLITKEFGAWTDPKVDTVEIPAESKQRSARSAEVKLDKPTQTRLAIAYKVPPFTTKDTSTAALALAAEMAFDNTSEFQKTYRYGKKWLDSVDAGPLWMIDTGLWTINLRLSEAGEAHEEEIVKAVEAVLAGLREKAPSQERLLATKKRFRNTAATTWFSTPEALAGRISWITNFEADLGVIDRYFGVVDAITPEQIKQFAADNLVDANKTVVRLRGKK